jgi:hypothetical protein
MVWGGASGLVSAISRTLAFDCDSCELHKLHSFHPNSKCEANVHVGRFV